MKKVPSNFFKNFRASGLSHIFRICADIAGFLFVSQNEFFGKFLKEKGARGKGKLFSKSFPFPRGLSFLLKYPLFVGEGFGKERCHAMDGQTDNVEIVAADAGDEG